MYSERKEGRKVEQGCEKRRNGERKEGRKVGLTMEGRKGYKETVYGNESIRMRER